MWLLGAEVSRKDSWAKEMKLWLRERRWCLRPESPEAESEMGILGKRESAQGDLVKKEEMQARPGEEGKDRRVFCEACSQLDPRGSSDTYVAPRSVCHWLKAASRDKSIHETESQTWRTDWCLPTESGLSERCSGKEVSRCKLFYTGWTDSKAPLHSPKN